MVKVAAAHGLGTLGSYSKAAVSPLVAALPGEPEATARAAFLEALEVRKTAVTFRRVPTDDFWVAPSDSERGPVANSGCRDGYRVLDQQRRDLTRVVQTALEVASACPLRET